MPSDLVTAPRQMELDLRIEKEVEVDGVGMGVLSDGTPYLTARGLARMCGIDHTMILDMTERWSNEPPRPRERKIKSTLEQSGLVLSTPHIPIKADGVIHHAYPDHVCMAVLEYYAFDAGSNVKTQALKYYRMLARKSFREFIYKQVGYDPREGALQAWQYFHARVALVNDSVPEGYFSIFKEIADIMVTLIKSGADVGAHFVPDISVGLHWGNYWRKNGLVNKYGPRLTYEHNYPLCFPQSASNPQKPYCYPDAALPEFRAWVRSDYLPEKFPKYVMDKQKDGGISIQNARKVLAVIGDRRPKKLK